jgi:RNA polymerase sigma-70 factor (ECF subfamily)
MRAFLRKSLPTQDDAEDVLQETWLRAHLAYAGLLDPVNAERWLWSICRHVRCDWLRRTRRDQRLQVALSHQCEWLLREWSELHADDALERDGELSSLDREIRALPDRQGDVVIYRLVLGYSTTLTSRLMKIAPGTVKATLHQARATLRRRLMNRAEHDAA